MTTAPRNLQRLWRLNKGSLDAVGCIAEGFVPGLMLSEPSAPFVAIVSIVEGSARTTEVRRGQVVDVLTGFEQREIDGRLCQTLSEAMAVMETRKRELLDDGWTDIPIDFMADPD